MPKLELTNKTSGLLTAVRFVGDNNLRQKLWECQCNCGKKIIVTAGHFNSQHNKSCGCSTNRLKSETKLNSNNPNWYGNKVGYIALHAWVKRRLKCPDKCNKCKKECRPDLANISQKYKRDLSDWEWLCRKCHMKSDGRYKIFINSKRNSKTLCPVIKKQNYTEGK